MKKFKHIFFVLFFWHVNRLCMSDIHWIVNEQLIFGGNGTLMCFTNDSTTTWMKNSDVIAHRGTSFYPLKYSTLEEDNEHSLLVIMNFTEQDVNKTYTCLSGVHSYSDKLLLTENNYIYPPTNGSVGVDWILSEYSLPYVRVTIGKIYPLPECNITHNGENIESKQELLAMTKQFIHVYSDITLILTAAVDKDLCDGNLLSVVCNLPLSYLINEDATQTTRCNHHRKGNTANILTMGYVVAGAGLIVVFIIIGIVFGWLLCFRKGNKKLCCCVRDSDVKSSGESKKLTSNEQVPDENYVSENSIMKDSYM